MNDQKATPENKPWRTGWKWLVAVLVIGLALGAWRREIIDSPPYWDFAIGLWTEANFLAETGFDYAALWYDEKPIRDGGAHCYITSVMPTLLALAMSVGSPREVIVGYHWFTFFCAAIVLCQMVAILRSQVPATAAALVAVAVVTTPLFNVQVDMLGMEIPLTVCALAAMQFALTGRYGLAAVAGTAAFLVKATGVVVTAATVAFLSLYWFVEHDADSRRRVGRGVFWNVLALALQLLVVKWGGHIDSQLVPGHRSGAIGLLSTPYWSPDLVILAGIAVVASLWQVARWWRAEAEYVGSQRLAKTLQRCIREMPVAVYSWILIVGTCLAITRIILLPRYLLLVIPFLYFILVLLSVRFPVAKRSLMPGLATIVVLNLLGLDGRFLVPIPEVLERQFGVDGQLFARTGGLLERSREYLADHQANVAAMRAVEAAAGDDPIVAGGPFAHFLALPRLGYVTESLRGYAVNGFSDRISQFRDVTPGLLVEAPHQALFVIVGSTFYHHSNRLEMPAFEAGDELIFDDGQASPLQVFRKSWDEQASGQSAIQDWYLSRIWPRASQVDRALYLAAFRGQAGDIARALFEIESALEDLPQHPRLERAHAELKLREGDLANAVASAVAAVRSPLDDVPVYGDVVYADSEWYASRARARWEEFQQSQPLTLISAATASEDARRDYDLGWERLLAGDLVEAQIEFDRSRARDPHFVPAASVAACLALELGDAQGALDRLATWEKKHDVAPGMWSVAGRAHESLGAWEQAAKAFDRALEHHPQEVDVLRARARVAVRLDDPPTAIRMLERVLTIVPADEEAGRIVERLKSSNP
jgi:tetratricopeptide (TPR) repeat protein